jgi:hypothetical protein
MAVELSLTNVAFSFLLGLGPCRWRNMDALLFRRLGSCAILVGIAFIGALHLFAVHLWAATPLGGEGKAVAAIPEIIQRAPFIQSDVVSIFLLGIGLVFAFGAIWKAYFFDDPYPRYGTTHRRAKSAREEYLRARCDLFDELSEIEENAVEQLNTGIANLPTFPQMAIDVRAKRAEMLNRFRAYEMSVETAANQLLTLYRDINHAQRTTAPPCHFNEKWQLPHSFLMSSELKALLADPEVGDVGSSVAKLERLSNAIITQHERLHDRYPYPLAGC